jgi:integrase
MWLLFALEEALFRQARSPVTLHNYEVALRRWAACGVRSVSDVTVESAQRFVEARLLRCQVQSVATDFMALLAVLSHLETTGRFSATALAEVRRVSPRPPKRKQLCASFLTREQLDRYCAGADEDAARLVRSACYTGLRASELAHLAWSDVDLAGRTLHVRRGKTGARRVPLCAPAVDLLAPVAGTGPVFGGVGPRTLQDRVRWARAGSGVRVTLTLCRHTRASWWVAAGVPIAKVAKWLGHSVEVCARHYAGLADAYDPAAELGAAG